MTQEEAYNQREENVQYLRDTDWYTLRKIDTGEAIPEEVTAKRSECRIKVSEAQDFMKQLEDNHAIEV